jgi:RNA polymerase sigma-70 factor (ECF subfamily)
VENAPPARAVGTREADRPFFSVASITRERAGLLRFCTRLTGDAATAEDLSQEALLVAWRQAGEGRVPQDWQPYLFGIARRLCLNWRSRKSHRDLPFLSAAEGAGPGPSLDFPAPDPDPLASLLQSERAQIIDRALAEIDFNARALLVAYYIDEDPLSEIAGSLGLTENAAAVRMHRSREALKRALAGNLRADAAAHGLLTTDSAAGWDSTRLWCPRCGQHHLQGRFTPGASPARYDYALRCPDCDRGYGPPLGFTSAALPMEGAAVLDGVRGYRAAFKRLHGWWEGIYRGRYRRRAAPPASIVVGRRRC